MKILSISYLDKARSWELLPIEFGQLTLLVGASGVGKTQILRSIRNMTRIAEGASLNGVKWSILLEIGPGGRYEWRGEFENFGYTEEWIGINASEEGDESSSPKIISEQIIYNGNEVLNRDDKDIFFNGSKTVRLPQHKSVIDLIKDEPITIVADALKLVVFNDHTNSRHNFILSTKDLELDTSKYPDLQSIRKSDESIRTKLYLSSLVVPEIFDKIKHSFIEVFPFVTDIRIKPVSDRKVPNFLREFPFIQLRERGVDNWIDEAQLSSGMYRTLLQIGELHLCADGTVFLVDEFENSLGVNCIDDLTSTLITYERDLQFIITSHHPYIINSISHKNWKVVTRKGGTVLAKDASAYNLGNSKHKAFTQLINLDAYNEGVEE